MALFTFKLRVLGCRQKSMVGRDYLYNMVDSAHVGVHAIYHGDTFLNLEMQCTFTCGRCGHFIPTLGINYTQPGSLSNRYNS